MEFITKVILLLLALLTLTTAERQSHLHFPDIKQGNFAHSLKNYDIIHPQRIDHRGGFITHDVSHVISESNRHRRDVNMEKRLHYKLAVEGRDLHVSLHPNQKLFAPGLVVERRNNKYCNITRAKIERLPRNRCHFVGEVRGHENSKVALATCNGLMGMLHTDDGEYFIEPVKGHQFTDSSKKYPHLIYRRSSLPPELDIHRAQRAHPHTEGQGACGVEDTFEESEKERAKWEEEHKSDRRSSRHARRKRSISRERNVETLVVVDREMMNYYKDEDIQNYILTIMNMVSKMFHDVTIGNAINIALVRIIYLERDEKTLNITHHADNTLNSFCKWQNSINPKDDNHPNHHDVAILLTRYNICSRMNEPCSTLGLSQVSGMCQPHRSCNINEDTGLVLAYTVAHEIGHNFAMKHDTERNGCQAIYGHHQNIMSPQLSADASPVVWSNCSRLAITKFLDRDWGYCLTDEPTPHHFEFPVLPAGVMYDTDHQCRLQYGRDAQYCEGIDEICATLWCQKDNKCLTRLEAPAEGTLCDVNMWCESGACVPIGEKPEAIDGNWGEWGEWSSCSRTCGAGVSVIERHCNNPAPSNGGRYCLNHRKRYRICNTEPCAEEAPSFRHAQCAEFNIIPYKKERYHWEPINDQTNPCQLRCKPKGKYFSVMMRDIVKDGTPCRPGTRDMCINGLCETIGCDWVIDSNATEDRCGVCHGDGSSCTTVTEEFKKTEGLGYVEAMVIPAGARNIRVEEVAEANNYLAVRDDKGKFYLNGHWVIQWSGAFEAGGTTIHYKRDGNKESFNAAGPLKEPLHIMLLFQSQNPGVRFEFTVPNENVTSTRQLAFSWEYLDWTHCTSSCGGGRQTADVVCIERDAGQVEAMYCNASTKPQDKARSCNVHQCPARWWTGPWQLCSVTCGPGVHRRTVICTRSLGPDEQIALDDDECEAAEKPVNIEPCHHSKPCPGDDDLRPQWTAGPWSETCMGDPCDVQSRRVECSDSNAICDTHNKPPNRRQCSTKTCGKWLTSAWSQCSETCGSGVQRRQVQCVGGQHCHQDRRPSTQRPCHFAPCPTRRMRSTTVTVPTTLGTTSTNSLDLPVADDFKPVGKADFNTIQKKEKDLIWAGGHDSPKLNPMGESGGPSGRVEGGVLGEDTKEKTAPKPTDSSIMSTPFRYITSWLGLNDGEDEPEAIGEQEQQNGEPRHGGEQRQALEDKANLKSLHHRWRYNSSAWSECSVPCGGGDQTRSVSCVEVESGTAVERNLCQGQKVPVHSRPCQSQPCLRWSASQWSACSETCGEGRQTRHVHCPKADRCDLKRRPTSTRPCHNPECIDWVSGSWSECSKKCGGGEQIRNVQCINHVSMQPANGCHPYTKPAARQKCNSDPCLLHSAALMGYSQRECRSNIMSYHLCRQLKRQGRCKDRLIQLRCCRTCQSRPEVPRSPPTT